MTSSSRNTLIQHINQLLRINEYQDYAPNGLQVEGVDTIQMVLSGVTACQALLNEAVERQADLILVHHGYFWKPEPSVITGMHKKRIATLLNHQINLAAYHLPLDAHETLGNNVLLAKHLGINILEQQDVKNNPNLFCIGQLQTPKTAFQFADTIKTVLKREPLVEQANDRSMNKIAWCTGAAQDMIHQAIEAGCDGFLTGEVSERTIHIARENNINFFAAGHHATERYGAQALGEHIAKKFQLQHQFIDIDNPA